MQIQPIPCTTILNPTGGFLKDGFTHTVNLYRGCALGNSLCGLYCYAQWNGHHLLGRRWGEFLDAKEGAVEAYRLQYDRLKRPGRGLPRPIRVFMSSVTEPYPPQERSSRRTRRLLEAMVERPPDLLVIQSHTPLVTDDISVLVQLRQRTAVHVQITIETDREQLPDGFPRHAYSVASRVEALTAVRTAGLDAVCTISPLLPLDDPTAFARRLDQACDRVILDHYLLGDGSQGLRTKKTALPRLLTHAGYREWTGLPRFEEVVRVFREVMGSARIGVSREGFNAQSAPNG